MLKLCMKVAAAGLVDTWIESFMKPEVSNGVKKVQAEFKIEAANRVKEGAYR
jgi:hypothetical protein